MPIYSLLNNEIEPKITPVEVMSFFQIPQFHIIGLAAQEIQESKERIRSAMLNSGFEFPQRRVVVNLPPAHLHKSGTGTDFAIALAILAHSQNHYATETVASGELSLTGEIRPSGRLTRLFSAAAKNKIKTVLISIHEREAATHALAFLNTHPFLKNNLPSVYAVQNLSEAWNALETSFNHLIPVPTLELTQRNHETFETSKLIALPKSLERSILISLMGDHHLLLLGPKGVGKSHALEWVQTLRPLRSISSTLERKWNEELTLSTTLTDLVPCLRASMQIKPAALVGSASETSIKPGMFSRAHGGYLLADEFPEWSRDSRECLREPLELKRSHLHRKSHSLSFPADFVFVGTGNLCPCGGVPDSWTREKSADPNTKSCTCKPQEQKQYWKRLSGPVLDRIDLVSFIPFQSHSEMPITSVSPKILKEKVERVRSSVQKNFGVPPGSLLGAEVEYLLANHPKMKANLDAIHFDSFRDRHKCFRVALTLAQLNDKPLPDTNDFWEAYSYRPQRLHSI